MSKKEPLTETLKVIPIRQKDQLMYLTSINSTVLYKHGEVRRQIDDSDEGIQRILKEPRVDQIMEYISNNRTTPLFVTPIVVSLNSDYITDDNYEDIKPGGSINIKFADETKDLFNIIDGQHRVAGIKKYDIENGSPISLQLPVVYILDADLYSSAEIFLNINANQKPVDWSSLYNLFGILEKESGERTVPAFASKISSILNNSENSPFYQSIKMYGIKTNPDQFITQATVAHRISKNTWRFKSGKPRAFSSLYDDNSYKILAKAIMNIFNAFKDTYPNTWKSKDTLAKKSVGFMAIIDFMAKLMLKIGLKDLSEENFKQIFNQISNNFDTYQEDGEKLFSNKGNGNFDDKMSEIFKNVGSSESVAKNISDQLLNIYINRKQF